MHSAAHFKSPRQCLVLALAALLWGCAGAWAGAAIDAVNVEDLPRKTILLPNSTKAVFVTYGEHGWREINASVLAGKELIDTDVCLEAKYDSPVPPDKIKLFNLRGTVIIDDRTRFRAISSELQRGDNIFICGELRAGKGEGADLELRVVHLLKQPPDPRMYENKITMLEKKNDFDGLIELGHRIDEARKNSQFKLEEFDKLELLRNRAWKLGLTLKENALARDDADGLFALALQWRDLLSHNSKFRTLVEQVLKIDVGHRGASRVAEQELGLQLFENTRWLRPEQIKQILDGRKQEQERLNAVERANLEAKAKALAKAIADRPVLLMKAQAALRVSDAQAHEKAVLALGEAIGTSLDAGFGEEGVDILVNLSDRAVVPAFATALKTEFPEVRKKIFEALVWRGRHQEPPALDLTAKALAAEKDDNAARAGVDALVALGGRNATQTLIKGLAVEDRTVREDVIEGLKLVTKQSISSKEGWEDWWNRNKDNLKP